MSKPIVSSGRSRIAMLVLGTAALSLALPFSAHADGNHHGHRHGNHSRSYYQSDDGEDGDDGDYGPPREYYGGREPCRGPKHVRVYNNYYPVPVPVAVPVYPQEYPQAYPVRGGSNAVVRVGVDWVFGF